MNDEKRTIIFFDGICHLCNSFVDAMIHRDFKHIFRFAPLQGETAGQMLPLELRLQLNSIVLLHQGQLLQKSSAVLVALSLLPGWTKVFVILRFIPLGLRDWVYDRIAQRRYQIWGKRDLCRIPEPHERDYLLP